MLCTYNNKNQNKKKQKKPENGILKYSSNLYWKQDLTLFLLNTTCPVDLHCLSLNMRISIKNPGSSNLIGWKLKVGVAA